MSRVIGSGPHASSEARVGAGRILLRVGLAAVAVASAIAGCGRTGLDSIDEMPDGRIPGVHGFPSPGATTPTPTPTPEFGDGRDGDRTVATTVQDLNLCVQVLGTSGGAVTVTDTTGFAAGDRVLLWQVQAYAAVSGVQTPIAALDSAGRWQISEVASVVDATTLAVAPSPAFAYQSSGSARAQACRVPQFSNVTVQDGAQIEPLPWDGATGGVVAFFVSTTLDLAASGRRISAGDDGFRGGANVVSGNVSTDADLDKATDARKGEGIDGTAHQDPPRHGRGNLANGSGGGGGQDGGGGGGANAGAGGFGGRIFNNGDDNLRGLPGAPIAIPLRDRLLFGGGGGAGQNNDGGGGSEGGRGGGVILIHARRLVGPGDIHANGQGGGASGNNGGGGGGAGGSVLLRTTDASGFSGDLQAVGAAGGSVSGNHGPGGGGGGGRVRIEGVPAGTIDTTVAGATGGTDGNSARGSTAGAGGTVEEAP